MYFMCIPNVFQQYFALVFQVYSEMYSVVFHHVFRCILHYRNTLKYRTKYDGIHDSIGRAVEYMYSTKYKLKYTRIHQNTCLQYSMDNIMTPLTFTRVSVAIVACDNVSAAGPVLSHTQSLSLVSLSLYHWVCLS